MLDVGIQLLLDFLPGLNRLADIRTQLVESLPLGDATRQLQNLTPVPALVGLGLVDGDSVEPRTRHQSASLNCSTVSPARRICDRNSPVFSMPDGSSSSCPLGIRIIL